MVFQVNSVVLLVCLKFVKLFFIPSFTKFIFILLRKENQNQEYF